MEMRSGVGGTWAWVVRLVLVVAAVLNWCWWRCGAGVVEWRGRRPVADAVWLADGGCLGFGDALWSAVGALRHGRVGVDVIALLALAGALAVGELLAGGA